MKAKIRHDGTLDIERNGNFKAQVCPFQFQSGGQQPIYCGDWCPLFVELSNQEYGANENPEVQLTCGTALHEIVSDERKAGDAT